jgi:hypothetical protein
MKRSEAGMQDRNDGRGPIRSEVKTKQGGPSRLNLWVLIGSLILAVAVGAMLLADWDEVPPSEPRNAVEDSPNAGSPPTVPPAEPRTNQ